MVLRLHSSTQHHMTEQGSVTHTHSTSTKLLSTQFPRRTTSPSVKCWPHETTWSQTSTTVHHMKLLHPKHVWNVGLSKITCSQNHVKWDKTSIPADHIRASTGLRCIQDTMYLLPCIAIR